MSAWKAKRFWKEAAVESVGPGYTVRLDGRPVKTPAKTPLVVPTLALAEAIAAEWDAQQGAVRPETMPFTRAANSALDKVTPQFDAVVDMLAAYGGTDLLCYRATGPEALVARQAAAWDPLLDWSATALGAPLRAVAGVMHIAQAPASLDALRQPVADMTPFQLAAFHDLVAISGSLVLALAVIRGRLPCEAAWELSRIDENWQIEQWGDDEEAALLTAVRHTDFLQAGRFYALCG
ncbi:ATP12 family protein [Paragemmobacter straminiformis]|uniref:ATPase n=1 Tax=Paragemmobacter straminiformis TaxID=2045119 RepID=A0A842ICB7_9RHOB|nr:ATPase [Gemmobacter straminiformis]